MVNLGQKGLPRPTVRTSSGAKRFRRACRPPRLRRILSLRRLCRSPRRGAPRPVRARALRRARGRLRNLLPRGGGPPSHRAERWRLSNHKSPGSATGCAAGSGAWSGSVRSWVLSANNSPRSNSSKPVRLRSNPASASSPISSEGISPCSVWSRTHGGRANSGRPASTPAVWYSGCVEAVSVDVPRRVQTGRGAEVRYRSVGGVSAHTDGLLKCNDARRHFIR